MEIIDKLVDYEKYCKTCEHRDLEEKYDPCNECLSNPVMTNTSKPLCYKEDEKKVKEEQKKKG